MARSQVAATALIGAILGGAFLWRRRKQQQQPDRVLVVGSINVDLYQKMPEGSAKLGGKSISMTPIKGMTLPAKSFLANPQIAAQLKAADLRCKKGGEEALLLTLDGPFEQKTGGKGANAAAAAGQTYNCEFIGNFGENSTTENPMLLADLARFGAVDVGRCTTLRGCPTGTAYILLFPDNDNGILLLGGANQRWPSIEDLCEGTAGAPLRDAVRRSVALMLQREVPEHVNVACARIAAAAGSPVVMDVGGTDAPLDPRLLPYVNVIAPNETELTFISGFETQRGGKTELSLVRDAVAALKAKAASCGNTSLEVLVTLGAMGSIHFGAQWTRTGYARRNGFLAYETAMGRFALSTVNGKPVDTTGAGDCYRGSYVAARYGEGKTVARAMRWAAAAGSLAVEIEGAMPAMPTRRQIEKRARERVDLTDLCAYYS